MASHSYRGDIDGLRAIAVVAVVIFHAFPDLCPGGFVGVDIFFVISGYLISSILYKDLRQGDFKFRNFYSRRIKRIFPALILVFAFCLFLGWFVLFPTEFAVLGKHIVASAAFLENVALWREFGYFNSNSKSKILLHLWSLGIEEQFYIIWPLLVVLLWKRISNLNGIIIALAIASFSTNAALVYSKPTFVFFLIPSRFWELLLGCGLAYVLSYRRPVDPIARIRPIVSKLPDFRGDVVALSASLLGLTLIGVAIAFIDRDDAFPGWWALLPTVGTCLIIWGGSETWVNRNVLANTVFVFVGMISYPLYLWHWPLLTFIRLMNFTSTLERAAVVILSVILAWFTYRFVESPIRFKKRTAKTAVILIALMTTVGTMGLVAKYNNGFDKIAGRGNPLSSDVDGWSVDDFIPCNSAAISPDASINECRQSTIATPTAAIFGDSHADHLFPGLAKADPDRGWLLVGASSCPPVSGINVKTDNPDCQKKSENIIHYLSEHKEITTVVLSFFGNYFIGTDFAADHLKNHVGPSTVKITSKEVIGLDAPSLFLYGLMKAVSELEASGKQVVVIIDDPELPFFARDCIARPFGRAARTSWYYSA